MTGKNKGFTLVEVIVVLVILAILAAIMIPAMTGWIDKAKEKRLIVECRTCVLAAQTLASESYSANGTSTAPDSSAVIALAGVKGTASNISLDAASAAVDTLTYSDGTESMTYTRMPTPQYTIGTGLAKEMSAASNWAQSYKPAKKDEAKEQLTKTYAAQNSEALSEEQKSKIFGALSPDGDYYYYPMAIYGTNGKPLNIQYVTPHNPSLSTMTGPNRYQATAFIIDGKTYVSTKKDTDGNMTYRLGGATSDFQKAMNNETFSSTEEFVSFITNKNYYAEVK